MLSSIFLMESLLFNCTPVRSAQISDRSKDKNEHVEVNDFGLWADPGISKSENISLAKKDQDNVGIFNNTKNNDITLQESISSNPTQKDESQNINPTLARSNTEFHSSIPMQNTKEQFFDFDMKFPDFFGDLQDSTVYEDIESTLSFNGEVQDSDLFDHDIENELENIIGIPKNSTDDLDQVLAKNHEINDFKAETKRENTLVLNNKIEYDMVQMNGVTVKVNKYRMNLKNIDSTHATFYFSVYQIGNKKRCYTPRIIVYVKMSDILREISDPKNLDVSASIEYQYKLMKGEQCDLKENERIYIENRINVCRQVFLDYCLFGWKSIASLAVVSRGVLWFDEIDDIYIIQKSYFNAIETVSTTKNYVLKRLSLQSNHYSGENNIVERYEFECSRVYNLYK